MKKMLLSMLALAILLVATISFAAPTSIGFRSYSANGLSNYATTCSVVSGKAIGDGVTFTPETITNFSMSKAGTGTFNTVRNTDYKVACFQTASPKDAVVVKVFFNGSEATYFPLSSIVFRRDY